MPHLGELDIIPDGAVYLQDDAILQVGTSADLLQRFPDEARLDAHRQVVMPGFVDPHTHLIWAGDRANEFTQRLEGKSYMEIMAAGGGINATVQATRHASSADLKKSTSSRAWSALRHGTTTLEAKSGYALDMPGETAFTGDSHGVGDRVTAGYHPPLTWGLMPFPLSFPVARKIMLTCSLRKYSPN